MNILRFCAILTIAAAQGALSAANYWDEQLEGGWPLPPVAPYDITWYENYAAGFSEVTQVALDGGNVGMLLSDNSPFLKGRLNRGNWNDAQGMTLHTRFRIISGDAGVLGIQVNDGVGSGRINLLWTSGVFNLNRGTPDPGSPVSISAPAGEWVEMWVRISLARFDIYLRSGDQWNLATRGDASQTGGVVYVGSNSISGVGKMTVDFWRIERTGAWSPDDPDAPRPQPVFEGTIGGARALPGGAPVGFADLEVTGSFQFEGSRFFYVQDPDRASGIRVNSSTAVARGDRVTFDGHIFSRNQEQQVLASGLAAVPGAPSQLSLGVSGSVAGQSPGQGPPTSQGQLVRIWGSYRLPIDQYASLIYLDDGSGYSDGASTDLLSGLPMKGIAVNLDSAVSGPLPAPLFGDLVMVEGNLGTLYHAGADRVIPVVWASGITALKSGF